jgi:hypothetical protein
MAQMKGVCSNCGRQTDVRIGQAISGNMLYWNQGSRCDSCNYQLEADGFGFPPEELRQMILQQDGKWDLIIEASTPGKTRAASFLRAVLNLSIPEAVEIIRTIPGVVFSGTQAEVEWLRGLLLASVPELPVRSQRS